MSTDGKTAAKPAKPLFTETDVPPLFKTLLQYLDKKYDVNYNDGADSFKAFAEYITEYVLEVDDQVRNGLDSE